MSADFRIADDADDDDLDVDASEMVMGGDNEKWVELWMDNDCDLSVVPPEHRESVLHTAELLRKVHCPCCCAWLSKAGRFQSKWEALMRRTKTVKMKISTLRSQQLATRMKMRKKHRSRQHSHRSPAHSITYTNTSAVRSGARTNMPANHSTTAVCV